MSPTSYSPSQLPTARTSELASVESCTSRHDSLDSVEEYTKLRYHNPPLWHPNSLKF